MTFEIDTGATYAPQKAVDYCADWLRDQCANWQPGYTDAQVVQAYAHHIIGDMKRPKKFETVIGQMTFNWAFLRCLAQENPGLFTEVWVAFAERFYGGE